MKHPAIKKACLVCFTICFLVEVTALSVCAHYLWVTPMEKGYAVARGMMPDRFEPYGPEAVKRIRAYDKIGREMSVKTTGEKTRAVFGTAAPPALISVHCDWGHRVNTTQGKKLMDRKTAESQGFRVLESFTSTQTSKTVFADGANLTKPLDMVFELVPVKSPYAKNSEKSLELRLLFEGRPLRNAMVSVGDAFQTKTDSGGSATVPIIGPGWQVVMAKHTVPTPGQAGTDYRQYMTFFVFKGTP